MTSTSLPRFAFPYTDPTPKVYRPGQLAGFPSSVWESYTAASAHIRAACGLDRLSKVQAAEVRAAVAKHVARAERKAKPPKPPGRSVSDLRAELIRQTTPLVREALRGNYRVYALNIEVSIDRKRGVRSATSTKWVSGRGGFGHVTDGQTIHLSVMPSWQTRVLERGLSELDGLTTTHAYLVSERDGIEIYDAAWVRQDRGYSLSSQSGFLAYHSESRTSYHGTKDAKQAATGLRRKMTAQGVSPEVRSARAAARQAKQAERLTRFVEKISRWDFSEIGHVQVTLQDSYRAGNCEPGTQEFGQRYFPGRESATIAEIGLAVGRVDPTRLSGADLTLARQVAAACLQGIRRDRSASRSLVAAGVA